MLLPYQIAKQLEAVIVQPNAEAKVNFRNHSQPQLSAYLWEREERGKKLLLRNNQLIFPKKSGKYVIEVIAEWANGESSYTFVAEVQ